MESNPQKSDEACAVEEADEVDEPNSENTSIH